MMKKNNNNLIKQREGISLLLVILILGIMLATILTASDIILRQGRSMKKITDSERAYFAAEAGIEISLYEINKARSQNVDTLDDVNCWCGVSCNNCQLNYSGIISQWKVAKIERRTIKVNELDTVVLPPGQSYQLTLDVRGVPYPTNKVTFKRTSGNNSCVISFEEHKTTGVTSQDDPNCTASVDKNLDNNYYYKFRILNSAVNNETVTYEVKPVGGGPQNAMTTDVVLTVSGEYNGVERIVTATTTKWQLYGL